jgi:AcrR family transcriptional regulator
MAESSGPSGSGAPTRPRGRPRDPERMARVLLAAKKHFTEHGYEGASIEAIADASGVSKVTIYSYFPTKADLFQAAISYTVEAQFSSAEWSRLDPRRPAEGLTRIGRAFLALMRSPDVVNHHRTLYGAIGQDTAAASSFFRAGPASTVNAVAEYLRAANRAGSLKVANPGLAANQYLSLYLGLGHVQTMLGLDPPSKAQDEALVKANVNLFLRAFAA